MFYMVSSEQIKSFIEACLQRSLLGEGSICERYGLSDEQARQIIGQVSQLYASGIIWANETLHVESSTDQDGDETLDWEEAELSLPKAAGFLDEYVFDRPVKVRDIILDVAHIIARIALAAAIEEALSSDPQGLADALDQGGQLPKGLIAAVLKVAMEVRRHARRLSSLPPFEGIEHCVYINVACSYGGGERFTLEQLVGLFCGEDACDIPANGWRTCVARSVEDSGSLLCGVKRSQQKREALAGALESLVKKRYVKKASDGYTVFSYRDIARDVVSKEK